MRSWYQNLRPWLRVRSGVGASAGIRCAGLPAALGLALLSAGTCWQTAAAYTLRQAMEEVYRTSPQLSAARATLRATDEEVARAHATFRPVVTGRATTGWTRTDNEPRSSTSGEARPNTVGVNLAQPLFRGLRSINQLRVAEASVLAGRETLRSVEQTILLQAVTAFMDVVRDQAIVRLNENNVTYLTRQRDAAMKELRLGAVSRTDVAQADLRRAGAQSALAGSRANLLASVANFERIIGIMPPRLRPQQAPAQLLPKSKAEVIEVAPHENPLVRNALFLEQAARHTIEQIRGELLPTVTLNSSYTHSTNPSGILDRAQEGTVSASMSVPLYSGGDVEARVRQAKQNHIVRLRQIEQVRKEQLQLAIAAWGRYKAAKDQVVWAGRQIAAAQQSLDGVRAEYKFSQRTLLDVLNAEQELLQAEVTEVTARRDAVVQAFTLLQAIGRLDASRARLGVEVYDATANYFAVRRKWFGLSVTHADGRKEKVELPAEDWPLYSRRRRAASDRIRPAAGAPDVK